jgi:hypothetical protein
MQLDRYKYTNNYNEIKQITQITVHYHMQLHIHAHTWPYTLNARLPFHHETRPALDTVQLASKCTNCDKHPIINRNKEQQQINIPSTQIPTIPSLVHYAALLQTLAPTFYQYINAMHYDVVCSTLRLCRTRRSNNKLYFHKVQSLIYRAIEIIHPHFVSK